MRKVVIRQFGQPDVLRVEEHVEPTPPDDGYVVQVRAAGVNFADVVLRRGYYRKNQELPCEIGFEASGVVVARGPRAGGLRVGQRAIVVKLSGGCYAERVAVGPDEIVPAREDLGFEELAGYANTFATAWYALREIGRVRSTDSVLIHAGAGGVGSACVQLARALGCRHVLATAGGEIKCRWVEDLGADCCIDYTSQDFVEDVRSYTEGRGVDFVLESVGGDVFERSLTALAPLGKMVVIGFSAIEKDHAQAVPPVRTLSLFHRSVGVFGLNVANLRYPARTQDWNEMEAFCLQHALRPQIGASYRLEDAAKAHHSLETRRSKGKLVLVP